MAVKKLIWFVSIIFTQKLIKFNKFEDFIRRTIFLTFYLIFLHNDHSIAQQIEHDVYLASLSQHHSSSHSCTIDIIGFE